MFLSLCVPEELKQMYIDRYTENSKLLEEKSEFKKSLESLISDKPVTFTTKSVANIASDKRMSQVKDTESELIANFLEYENPTQTIENSVSLND